MEPKLYACESADKCTDKKCPHMLPHTTTSLCNNKCNVGQVKDAKCIEVVSTSEAVKSTWYSENVSIGEALDLSKPIMCRDDNSKRLYLLMPQIASTNKEGYNLYGIIGYNWLNIENGTYDSCAFFKTIKEAIQPRYTQQYTLFNYEFILPTNLGE